MGIGHNENTSKGLANAGIVDGTDYPSMIVGTISGFLPVAFLKYRRTG